MKFHNSSFAFMQIIGVVNGPAIYVCQLRRRVPSRSWNDGSTHPNRTVPDMP
jgi:hypothetical protein